MARVWVTLTLMTCKEWRNLCLANLSYSERVARIRQVKDKLTK